MREKILYSDGSITIVMILDEQGRIDLSQDPAIQQRYKKIKAQQKFIQKRTSVCAFFFKKTIVPKLKIC